MAFSLFPHTHHRYIRHIQTYNSGHCIYKYIHPTLVNAIHVNRHVVSILDHEQVVDVYDVVSISHMYKDVQMTYGSWI